MSEVGGRSGGGWLPKDGMTGADKCVFSTEECRWRGSDKCLRAGAAVRAGCGAELEGLMRLEKSVRLPGLQNISGTFGSIKGRGRRYPRRRWLSVNEG
jgi:hypothetical protein